MKCRFYDPLISPKALISAFDTLYQLDASVRIKLHIAECNTESTTTKYMIHADFNIEGIVEKPDVVGALFGQTEGLLSDDLDLRELQKGGRVGRIQVSLIIRGGRTKGSLSVPSSLDKELPIIIIKTIKKQLNITIKQLN